MSFTSKVLAVVVIAISFFANERAIAQNTKPYTQPSIEELFKPPQLSNIALSRSGRYIAALTPARGKRNIVVIDLESRKGSVITGYENFDVDEFSWIGDDRIAFTLGNANAPTGPAEFDGGGFFVVNRDGTNNKQYSSTIRDLRATNSLVYRRYNFVRTIPGTTDEIIVSGNYLSADSVDLYRMNLVNGRTTLITENRPASYTTRWLLDDKLVPRVVTAGVKDESTRIVYYRSGEKAQWVEIARYNDDKGDVFVPLAIRRDSEILQVASNIGRNTMGIFLYDAGNKKMGELVASHPRFDMGANSSGERVPGLIGGIDEENVVEGFRVQAMKPEVVWYNPERAQVQATLDASFPNVVNNFVKVPNGNRYLVTSYSDTQPGKYFILDWDKKSVEEIGVTRPWLEGKLVQQRPFFFKTRDGLEIGGYYFLPASYKEGTKLPTVLHIHGGPSVRADRYAGGFGYQEGQLFASRGYAVVVPNFRVTPGFGQKIYQSGFGTVGRQMSEDHEDALKWAIEQGFADPARACISGASYGGYAALQALAKTPEMFKCAVAGLAVTDFTYQLTTPETDFASSASTYEFWRKLLGTRDFTSDLAKSLSPINYPEKIKGAVFLYAGQDDFRVPIGQINRMDRALRNAGNPPKAYVVKAKEGHGFGILENNVDLYTQVLKFLDDSIGKK